MPLPKVLDKDLSLLSPEVEAYLHRLLPRPHPVVAEMEAVAAKEDFPIVGPLVGRLLFQLTKMIRAKTVLELGSGYGYSAFWFASALPEGGVVHCTDGNAVNISRGKEYLAKAGLGAKIHYHEGNALETIDRLPGEFDIIFMDIDKGDYPAGGEKAIPRLRPGGLFITDNTLWSGKVANPAKDDEWTNAIVRFTKALYADPRLWTTILPIRDGVAVALMLDPPASGGPGPGSVTAPGRRRKAL